MISHLPVVARRFHELSAETFVQATEDEEKVGEAVRNLLGGETAAIEITRAEGVHGNPILILNVAVRKEREIEEILRYWKGKSFFLEALDRSDERLDDDLVFHMRVGKSSAYEGEPQLWTEGESIRIKLKIAAYPSSRESAMEVLKEFKR
jgi:RNA binding exosome subunit